jgi:subfamily B ATP-binding cassette protein MsbA
MEKNLIKLLPYTKPYKTNIVLNIVYNVLYALFSTLSMITLFPLLEVLFKKSNEVIKEPVFNGIENIGKFGKEWLFYNISHFWWIIFLCAQISWLKKGQKSV